MTPARDGAALAVTEPLGTRLCVVCQRALEDRYWMVRFPDGAHEECIDWTHRAFPFEREIVVLRRLARRAHPAESRSLILIANELEQLRARWPSGALDVLVAGRRVTAEARRHLADLDHRLRQKL